MAERQLAVIAGDRIALARFSDALKGIANVWPVLDVHELATKLGQPDAPIATIICLAHAGQDEALRAVDTLRAIQPDHAIIGYVDRSHLSAKLILEAGRSGFSDFVIRDVDDTRAVFARVVQNAAQQSVAERLGQQVAQGLPRPVRQIVLYVCRHLREPLDVPSIAGALGVSRRTLNHRLGQVGGPSPRELMGWCRVLYIANRLADADVSMATIAEELDCASWRNLASLVRRYLSCGVSELRHPDGFAQAMRSFHAAFGQRPREAMILWSEIPSTSVSSSLGD